MALTLLLPERVEARDPALGSRLHALGGRALGTRWSVRVAAAPDLAAAALSRLLQAELDAVEDEMSPWRPPSALSRFNRAPAGSRHTVPAGFAEVLSAALAVAEASGGAFDPTLGRCAAHWGFGAAGGRWDDPAFAAAGPLPAASRPSGDTAARCAALQWDPVQRRLTQPGGLWLDFGGIAKGHAVDRLSRRLGDLGLADHLVEVGGELIGRGLRPDGQPWWVDVASPDGAPVALRVALHGLAVATSGDDQRRSRDAAGRPLHHTLDPRSGAPLPTVPAAVSVLVDAAVPGATMLADAWATAFGVLPAPQAQALAIRLDRPVIWVHRGADGALQRLLSPAAVRLAG